MDARFSKRVTTEAEIRELLGQPSSHVLRKASKALDDACRDFIARCPFLLIASCDAAGNMDVSPKGDPAGFVRVLDETTLAIPDRPGNRRADTFRNLLQRPQIGLLFLVPGRGETLRLHGTAIIVRDRWLREDMVIAGKLPAMALVVDVGEVFFHCPKCVARSKLWDSTQWPDLKGLASYARVRMDRGGLEESVEEMETRVAKDTCERLY